MPPAAIRRPITVAVWLVMSAVCLILSPVLLALAALASAVSGRPQPLIFTRLVVAYFALELSTLIACGGAMACQLRRNVDGHGALPAPALSPSTLVRARLRRRWSALLEIDVAADEPTEAMRAMEADRPLLFFSRHAGPGDTILLIDRLLTRFDRLPSIVFKQSVIDPMCRSDRTSSSPCGPRHRRQGGVRSADRGGRSRARQTRRPAVVPGGRQLHRRAPPARGPETLAHGPRREAAKAERMSHVLPPRPSGALAALRATRSRCHLRRPLGSRPCRVSAGDLARGAAEKTFTTHMWLSPADQRPSGTKRRSHGSTTGGSGWTSGSSSREPSHRVKTPRCWMSTPRAAGCSRSRSAAGHRQGDAAPDFAGRRHRRDGGRGGAGSSLASGDQPVNRLAGAPSSCRVAAALEAGCRDRCGEVLIRSRAPRA